VTRREPRWLGRLAVDEAHFRQLREHGGAHGVRDDDALEAALARPRHRWAYEADVDLAELAAAYGFGIPRNHPFVHGNKRVALVAMVAFLDLNGIELTASDEEVLETMMSLGAGSMTELELASWIRRATRMTR
jgi:death-on-curing protein